VGQWVVKPLFGGISKIIPLLCFIFFYLFAFDFAVPSQFRQITAAAASGSLDSGVWSLKF
jgi:hypothetical protein